MGAVVTVAQLIVELQKLDGNLEVMTEGCDCDGDAGSIEVANRYKNAFNELQPFAYIRRKPYEPTIEPGMLEFTDEEN